MASITDHREHAKISLARLVQLKEGL